MNVAAHHDSRRYRQLIEEHGFSATHQQAIAWVPKGSRVLEIGCASGLIGERLIVEKGCQVIGAEIDPGAGEEARGRGLDVRLGSVEDPAFRESLGGGYERILATDVLEHLVNPELVLDHMRRWLAPGGRAIVAVPNVAVWSMRLTLLKGKFEYADSGLLDRTHLRFFTWDTFHALLDAQRWRVEDTMVEGWELPGGALFSRRLRERILRSVGPRFPNVCAGHIAVLIAPR